MLLKHILTENVLIEEIIEHYCSFYHELAQHNENICFKGYLTEKMLFDENPFTRAAENNKFNSIDKNLVSAACKDLSSLQTISEITSNALKSYVKENVCKTRYEQSAVESLPEWECKNEAADDTAACSVPELLKGKPVLGPCWDTDIEELAHLYYHKGTGIYLKYNAFVWERSNGTGNLRGISKPDPITLSDLIGYKEERSEVLNNTQQFLKGYPANNVLLYGDRGTGKSSTVKAILNEYSGQGLKIIEVPKAYLIDFPNIIRLLKGRRQKFIIFVDDLVFEDSEENYTTLKAVLEGGLENRPPNVLIYATSNRRHLIKEKFSDRKGLQSDNADDEIRAADTIQEKLSLSDRFGITVVFSSPDKYRYLEIVEGIAAKRGINIDREQLHKEAMKWEL
jgi:predicted AAA+ superfamily ATPase